MNEKKLVDEFNIDTEEYPAITINDYETFQNKKLLEESGYNSLMTTINSINSRSEIIQKDSLLRSFNVQMSRDVNIHEKIKLYIESAIVAPLKGGK